MKAVFIPEILKSKRSLNLFTLNRQRFINHFIRPLGRIFIINNPVLVNMIHFKFFNLRRYAFGSCCRFRNC